MSTSDRKYIASELNQLYLLGTITKPLLDGALRRLPRFQWRGPGSISEQTDALLDETRAAISAKKTGAE